METYNSLIMFLVKTIVFNLFFSKLDRHSSVFSHTKQMITKPMYKTCFIGVFSFESWNAGKYPSPTWKKRTNENNNDCEPSWHVSSFLLQIYLEVASGYKQKQLPDLREVRTAFCTNALRGRKTLTRTLDIFVSAHIHTVLALFQGTLS